VRARAVRESSPVDIRDFGSLLWRRKWTLAAVAAAVVGAALLVSMLQTPVYQAKASVLVESPPGEVSQNGPNMATEKRVGTSHAVAKIALAALHLRSTPEKLLPGLSVDVPVDTEILDFTYSDPSPEMAQRKAEAFAQAYLQFRQKKLVEDVLAASRSLDDQIRVLNGELAVIHKKTAATTDRRERGLLAAQATLYTQQINNLELKRAQLTPTEGVSPGSILADATTPTAPARPDPVVNGLLGLVVGLVLGVGAALLRDYLDDHIRGTEDLESQVGAPVLSVVPPVRPLRGAAGEELVTLQAPDSAAAEAFRHLRANFVVAAASCAAKVVLFTSPREEEGKTLTTANLAVLLARTGSGVILLSADVRRPRLDQLFGVSARPGFSDALTDGIAPPGEEIMDQIVSVAQNLSILPMGSAPSNPIELLGSSEMRELVQVLRQLTDYVLIDAAPLLSVADAAALIPACDAVVVVADARSATRPNLLGARQQLERMQAKVLGTVLVNARVKGLRSYPDGSTGARPRIDWWRPAPGSRNGRGVAAPNGARQPDRR
jgi:capsular exopolysaccharide synthesis family protein